MNKKTYVLLSLIFCLLLFNIGGLYYIHQNQQNSSVQEESKDWITISPKGAYSSDGSAWSGLYKKGSENKTLIFFVGGGMSFSREMDENNSKGYYEDSLWYLDQLPYYAIFADVEENPYRNWNYIVIPYSSGDLHIGNVVYEDEQGNLTYHQGYKNYTLFMESIKEYLGSPEALVISGSSAGGFGAALLSDDVLDYFPNTKNVVTFVDAGFLLYDDWLDCAQNIWEAPKEIVDCIYSNNIVLDALQALKEDREYVKILFACSTRDSALQSYQSYIDTGYFGYSLEAGDIFFENLKQMVIDLQEIKDSAVYIFDTSVNEEYQLTRHMVLPNNPFSNRVENISPAQWLEDALNGDLNSYGLYLLEE